MLAADNDPVAKQQRGNKVSPDVSGLEAGKENAVAPVDGRMLFRATCRRHLYVASVYRCRQVSHVRHLRWRHTRYQNKITTPGIDNRNLIIAIFY